MYFGFRDINVDYGKKKVLSELSLDVPKGKIMTLIGQNGCGKSTLLSIIAGLYKSYEGKVIYAGTEIKNVAEQQS